MLRNFGLVIKFLVLVFAIIVRAVVTFVPICVATILYVNYKCLTDKDINFDLFTIVRLLLLPIWVIKDTIVFLIADTIERIQLIYRKYNARIMNKVVLVMEQGITAKELEEVEAALYAYLNERFTEENESSKQ